MEVDEDQWKPRDKLLLVEAVISGAAGGGSNGNRGDSGGGQEGKRDVNWAAVSRLLRKHIPKKRLTTPTSFGSKVHFFLFLFVFICFYLFLLFTFLILACSAAWQCTTRCWLATGYLLGLRAYRPATGLWRVLCSFLFFFLFSTVLLT
jgi:hypothetical protein